MSTNFDLLELRSEDARTEEQFAELRKTLRFAVGHAPGLAQQLDGIDIEAVKDRADLAALPVLRKADLAAAQTPDDPLAGFATRRPYHFRHLFMSPGPIFEPGSDSRDFYRLARFVHASGVGMGDIVLNCFSYHLTPAGMMFENAVASVSATVVPAGVGQTELQVTAARQLGVTAYAGTPDYLKVILDKADETGTPLKIARALVSGGALFPSLRTAYAERGVITRQCYATADLGNIAYESEALEGLIVDEGAILEIVRPGTGDPVPAGEVGEVVVTTLNPDYPLLRFATGDLSAVLPGESPCGRTNMRIRGWMGRADQATKIKGMFVRPEQVAALVARHRDVLRARVVVDRAGEMDAMTVKVETEAADISAVADTLPEVLKLRGTVEAVAPGSLPNDGIVIEDRRTYD